MTDCYKKLLAPSATAWITVSKTLCFMIRTIFVIDKIGRMKNANATNILLNKSVKSNRNSTA